MAQINKPDTYFNTVLYTGTGTTQSITGVGFQPDLYWNKSRSNVNTHVWIDSIRGVSTFLASNNTDADSTPGDGMLSSFDSDGFTLNADTSGYNNFSGRTYANWCWKAGGTAVSNTDGSITSTVSANTTSGFSIVSYTGNGSSTGSNVVGHGLGTTPSMIIIKARAGTNANNNWFCWHKGLSANNNISLSLTNAQSTTSTFSSGIINTSPTSTTFGFDSGTSVLNINENGTTYIAYCFAEKKGFSKFGSYTGNGSADGTFIYTGFKPAFVMVKVASGTTGNWQMQDTKRLGYNDKNVRILANVSEAEKTDQMWDILSNGFKVRSTSGDANGSGNTYIYMAFAESPLVGTNNIPAVAR